MISPLFSKLAPVARRYQALQLWRNLMFCWLAAAAVGLIALILHFVFSWNFGWLLPLIVLGAIVAATWSASRIRKARIDLKRIAEQIEQQHPELQALLLTAVEQKPDSKTGELSYLQKRVIREALAKSERVPWLDAVPANKMFWTQSLHWAALVLLFGTLIALLQTLPSRHSAMTANASEPGEFSAGIFVNPGDTNVEQGSSFVITARFENDDLPASATLIATSGKDSKRLPLERTLNDPTFGIHLPEVNSDFTYRIEYAGLQTRDFKVSTFAFPDLQRADAHLEFPGGAMKEIPDTLAASGPDGTLIDFKMQFNKSVASARLVAADHAFVPLTLNADHSGATVTRFPLIETKTYKLELTDADGRRNKRPIEFAFIVTVPQPPVLTLISPAGDARVSPLEEVAFKGEAVSDSGLRAMGLTYSVGGGEPQTILVNDSNHSEKRELAQLLALENLHAKSDQLLTYYLWADDVVNGKVRRTTSDLFYAEIRPFEETFRQGECKGSPSVCVKLIEQQKMIIDATWALRDEKATPLSADYKTKHPTVLESQQDALSIAQGLGNAAQSDEEKQNWNDAITSMDRAVASLKQASSTPVPLPNALSAEQAAYQALLRLAPRDHKLNPDSKTQKLVHRKNRQHDQLKLEPLKDVAETRTNSPAELDDRLKLLFRLKELAQHQTDINALLKELQTPNRGIQDAAARERELKRLSEDQRQLVAEMDQAKQQMEKMSNRAQQLGGAKRQLEQSRAQAQSTSQAIASGSVSQGLASGTRAQQGLEQVRDEFRKQSASAFAEAMQQMRASASALAEKEERIGSNLARLQGISPISAATQQLKQNAAADLAEQSKELAKLAESMRRVTEQAEKSEPLLSRKLYDALRNETRNNTGKALALSAELVKRNAVASAQPVEAQARKQIGELKQQIDQAADSVLGSEADALRFAKRELEQLNAQIAAANPKGTSAGNSGGRSAEGANPITGQEYLHWAMRLSNLEEALQSPELRADLARVREQARQLRADFKRHSREPEWRLIESGVANPLTEIHRRVADELAKLDSHDPLAPIDRDPVPARYAELVRQYYEQLGSGESVSK